MRTSADATQVHSSGNPAALQYAGAGGAPRRIGSATLPMLIGSRFTWMV
jgi:hypothetical protein